jgi:hypothetical protein
MSPGRRCEGEPIRSSDYQGVPDPVKVAYRAGEGERVGAGGTVLADGASSAWFLC